MFLNRFSYRKAAEFETRKLCATRLIADRAVVIIEWGERLGPALRPSVPGSVVEIHLAAAGESERRIEVR